MKKVKLNKFISKALLRRLIIIAVLVIVAGGSYFFNMIAKSKYTKLQQDIQSLQSQIDDSSRVFQESQILYKEYQTIPAASLATSSGYSNARDRLGIILPLIKDMKNLYLFKKLNLTIGQIQPIADNPSSIATPYESKVTLDFSGPVDEFLFSFINDLKHKLPGYASVTTLSLKRENDVSQNAINSFLRNKDYSFASGSVTLSWVTLKSNSAPAGDDAAAAAAAQAAQVAPTNPAAPTQPGSAQPAPAQPVTGK